jgi:hypothetical protein
MFFTETFAPAITLPLGSVTVPRMDPRKLCVHAGVAISNTPATPMVRIKIASIR